MPADFGFGCLRLPLRGDGTVDHDLFCRLIDEYMAAGFHYFDTARVYIGGRSETAVRDCLVKRYPRDSFILTDKLSGSRFQRNDQIEPLFESQLVSCGVDYFDYYFFHSQDRDNNRKFTSLGAYDFIPKWKAEGKIRHFGISFHDTADILEQILQEHPEIEVVQIQFNYIDYDDPEIQSKKCYDVCRKYGKPILVMEPVKGGTLLNLPERAKKLLDSLGTGSYASYALRFAAGFDGIMMVLSGMNTMDQVRENTAFMRNYVPLSERELSALEQVRAMYRQMNLVSCTGCRYCVDGCPKQIPIPVLFDALNEKKREHPYSLPASGGKASECIECGKCEKVCSQRLPVRELLKTAAKELNY